MDKSMLESLVSEGKSQREIGKIVGKSQASVKHWLKKYDLTTKRPPGASACKFCGETDPAKFVNVGDGRVSPSKCKACHSKYTIDRFRSYKLKAIEYKGGACFRCGYDACAGSLHFHHKDPSQKDPQWRLMRNWKFSRLLEELDKCDLVCANCHGEIHWKQVVDEDYVRRKEVQEGTGATSEGESPVGG